MTSVDDQDGGASGASAKRGRKQRTKRERGPRWRRILATLLIVVGCVLAPLSIAAIWVRDTLLDTSHYVDTVVPLAADPGVQDVLAHSVTNALFERVDVDQKLQDALPAKGAFLVAPLAGTLQTFAFNASRRAIQSDAFQALWKNANEKAHHQVVNLLTGKGKVVKNGQVAIPAAAIVTKVKAALDDKGIHFLDDVKLPPDKQQIVLFEAADLVKVQGAVNAFQKIAWALPIVAVLCFGGALLLSVDRRRSLVRIALGVAFSVGLLLVFLALGRGLYLNAVSSPKLPRDAASSVWDTIVNALRTAARSVFVLALVVAFAAWVVGPASLATRIRTNVRRGLARAGDAAGEPGAVAGFVGRYRGVFAGGGVAVALLVLVAWSAPTPLTILVVALILLVYLGLIAFLARDADTSPVHGGRAA